MKLLVQKDVSQTPIKSLFGVPSPTRRRPMMEDELKKNLIALFVKRGHKGKDIVDEVKEILALFAPILADAEKWKRFLAIQSCNDCPACPECPCDETNCPAIKIEDAFEGEGGKP